MKASVTSTDRLKLRSRAGSALASMKASMSGWSHRSVAIMAPRRAPADMMVRHMASHTSMKLTGPEASAPMLFTSAPLGRSVGEVVADAAALLHGQRGLLHVLEDGAEVVLDAAHHEAIEERDGAAGAGAGQDAAGGQEGEVGHRFSEAAGPSFPRTFLFYVCCRPRDALPGVGNRVVERNAVLALETILRLPDLFGDSGRSCRHVNSLRLQGNFDRACFIEYTALPEPYEASISASSFAGGGQPNCLF